MSTRTKKAINDQTRFEGNGISYKAKLIGIEDVPEARGDLMCQEALIKLKNSVKISGEHKRKIFINVTLEGLKIIDAISLIVLHIHPVHRISFISRDTTDNRAFGYVFGTEDGSHKFFAIKTATAAEQLVLTLRDLFQVVYEMKKKEMEAAKEKLQKEGVATKEQKENSQTSGTGSISGISQAPAQKASADAENIYQVPTNNAPVIPETRAEQVANLLDLEDQAEQILKGIEQIKNLEFDSVMNDTFSSSTSSSTSPLAKLTPALSTSGISDDPWGFSAQNSSTSASSPLGDLAGLQTGQFSALVQHPYASPGFPVQSGFGGPTGFNVMGGGLPLTKDPFANDPFDSSVQQPRIPAVSGFGAVPGYVQPYRLQAVPQGYGMVMPGMVPHGMMSPPIMGGYRSHFGVQQAPGFHMNNSSGNDPNILQPLKKDAAGQDAGSPEPVKVVTKSRGDLFSDLLEIKKSSPSTAVSPKDMFAQINSPERKPMNEMKGPGKLPNASPNKQAQASDDLSDPFGDVDSVILDKTRGLLYSDSGEEDPFDTSHIPPSLTEPLNQVHTTLPATPPPVPQRLPSSNKSITDTLSSCPMPSSSPPPPPKILSQSIPPLPFRNVVKQEIVKDLNENFSLDVNVEISSNVPFMLSSPDDPPPHLPPHLPIQSSPVMPPSPTTPRPNIYVSQPLLNDHHKLHEENTVESESVLESDLSNISSQAQISRSDFKQNYLKSQISESLNVNNSDTNLEINSHISKNNSSENNFNAFFNSHNNDNGSQSSQSDWVDFENVDNFSANQSDFFLPVVNKKGEDDPFNAPLSLTPGFKAVAKFGSDPFDDSFGEPLSNDPWDPFSSPEQDFNHVNHDSPGTSAFGDPFLAPTQQVASKSFFD